MKKSSLVLSLLLVGIMGANAQALPAGEVESKIDEYLKPYLDMNAWSGVVAIYQGHEPVFQKAYGYADREWEIRNSIDTKFRIASISKVFTEVAVLQLAEADQLSLTETLDTFVPDYPRGSEITIRQLLHHRSGIPHLNSFPNYDDLIKYDYTLEEIIALFKSKPLDFEPGERYRYSNSGYVLLAYIIEEVSGLSYADYLQQHIFDPLGLNDTGIDAHSKILENRARGYMFNSTGDLVNATPVNMSIKIGGGSLYSTTDDLNRFLGSLLQRKLIDSTLSELPNFGDMDGENAFTASGRVQGFCHQITHRMDQDLTIMVLGNHYSNLALPITDDIYQIYAGKPYEIPEDYLAQEIQVPVAALKEYEGYYNFGFGPVRKLEVKGDALTYGAAGQEAADTLIPLGNNRFFYIQYWVVLEFKNEENGKYATLDWVMGKNRFPAKRVVR